eukprot:352602-Chlamydomonas_euryale.AAC.1
MATTRWLVSCQAVCQQLYLPTRAFKATEFCRHLKDANALPDLVLAAAADVGGGGHGQHKIRSSFCSSSFCRDIGNALDALAC